VESSRQLLLWANTSKSPCHETYEWACGNFASDYANHDYFVIKRGEWNYETYNEYQGELSFIFTPFAVPILIYIIVSSQNSMN